MKHTRTFKTTMLGALLAGISTLAACSAPATLAPLTSTPVSQREAPIATANMWGIENVDLVPDPAIRYGVLANGMKYAIRHNETPKDSATVRMQINVGSIAEQENERGLAHFLEHMAFNGSANVPEGEMTKLLERQGLAFGADTNASTGFDATVYKLELPKTDAATIDAAMFIMRETAGELTIAPEAVNRERGVLLSEQQTRNTFGLRQIEKQLQVELPQAPFGNRLPIGTLDVLNNAPASRIKDFYQRYYRPENTTMVVVGDFDIDMMEAKIRQEFGDWKPVGPAGAPLDRGTVDPDAAPIIGTFSDPAVPVSVSLSRATPYTDTPNSVAVARDKLLDLLATLIVNRRLSKLATSADAPIVGGGVSLNPLFNAIDQASISLRGKEGEWKQALFVGEQELRRALQYGFTQGELTEQMANVDTLLRNAAEQQGTRTNRQLAEEIVGSIYDASVVMTPAEQLNIYNRLKPELTLDAVNTAFREAWGTGPNRVFVSTKEPIATPEQTVMTALAESSKVAVAAPIDVETQAFAYDNFGTPGTVTSDVTIPDLGIRAVQFANNVKLNIKKTDFETGKARYSMRLGGGQLALPENQPGLGFFMSNTFNVGALEAHDVNELQQILAGRAVSGTIAAGDDAFVSRGETTPADLELQLQLLAAYVTAPGFRPAADTLWQNAVPGFAGTIDATPMAVAGTQLPAVLAGGDKRFGIPPIPDLLARNMAELEPAIREQLANAPIEIAIVGDVDEQRAIDLVAKTFGALPARAATMPDYADRRAVSFAPGNKDITLYHKGADDQAMVFAYWPTTDDSDYPSVIARSMLAEVMQSLLLDEVREKLGATYSPGAGSFASDVYTGYGYMQTQVVVDPSKIDNVLASVREIAKSLRDTPVSEDVLLRARKPTIERLDKQERENGAWLSLIADAQSDPETLDRRRGRKAAYLAITPVDIQAAARAYLREDTMVEARIISEKLK